MAKNILITGGAGFIGSHIVDALVDRGDQVIVIDNMSTGDYLHSKAPLKKLDIGSPAISSVFDDFRPGAVIHLAAQVNLRRSVECPSLDAQINILGSLNLIQQAVNYEVKKFIYASSGGAVYGQPQYLPVDENHPINPISPYGISKYSAEQYLRLSGLNYTILRYSNVYGPRQNPKGEAGVVAIFATQMRRHERPTIFGSGAKTRDYVYVSDVVRANLLALEDEASDVYNIGTGQETCDIIIYAALARLLNYRGDPNYSSVRPGEIDRICLDCSKARGRLGWEPLISLEDGLSLAVASG